MDALEAAYHNGFDAALAASKEALDMMRERVKSLEADLALLGSVTAKVKTATSHSPPVTVDDVTYRAQAISGIMNWELQDVKPGYALFRIDNGETYTLIEFAAEHFAVIDALTQTWS